MFATNFKLWAGADSILVNMENVAEWQFTFKNSFKAGGFHRPQDSEIRGEKEYPDAFAFWKAYNSGADNPDSIPAKVDPKKNEGRAAIEYSIENGTRLAVVGSLKKIEGVGYQLIPTEVNAMTDYDVVSGQLKHYIPGIQHKDP